MDDSPLKDRTIVVTGAARGIGAALANALAGRGARLALLDHDEAALVATAAALPGTALAIRADVTDGTALNDAAEAIRTRLGPPSAVVANAGIAEGGPFALSDPDTWRRVIDVNLIGSAQTARAFLPDLIRTAGYHLQIASLASIGAAPMMSAYCASKSGVEAFTHTLRAETAHHGVAVGIAYLGWTDTELIRDADHYAAMRELRGHMPPPSGASTPPKPSPPAWHSPWNTGRPPCTSPAGCAWPRSPEPRSRPSSSARPAARSRTSKPSISCTPRACSALAPTPTAPRPQTARAALRSHRSTSGAALHRRHRHTATPPRRRGRRCLVGCATTRSVWVARAPTSTTGRRA